MARFSAGTINLEIRYILQTDVQGVGSYEVVIRDRHRAGPFGPAIWQPGFS